MNLSEAITSFRQLTEARWPDARAIEQTLKRHGGEVASGSLEAEGDAEDKVRANLPSGVSALRGEVEGTVEVEMKRRYTDVQKLDRAAKKAGGSISSLMLSFSDEDKAVAFAAEVNKRWHGAAENYGDGSIYVVVG